MRAKTKPHHQCEHDIMELSFVKWEDQISKIYISKVLSNFETLCFCQHIYPPTNKLLAFPLLALFLYSSVIPLKYPSSLFLSLPLKIIHILYGFAQMSPFKLPTTSELSPLKLSSDFVHVSFLNQVSVLKVTLKFTHYKSDMI